MTEPLKTIYLRALCFTLAACTLWLQAGLPNFPSAHAQGETSFAQKLDEIENADPRLRTASLNIYVATKTREPFALDTLELKLDGKRLVRHLYTERESGALAKSAVHRIYSGNLGPGSHEFVAEFIGFGKGHRSVTGKYSEQVSPGIEPTHIELLITDAAGGESPKFKVRKW